MSIILFKNVPAKRNKAVLKDTNSWFLTPEPALGQRQPLLIERSASSRLISNDTLCR